MKSIVFFFLCWRISVDAYVALVRALGYIAQFEPSTRLHIFVSAAIVVVRCTNTYTVIEGATTSYASFTRHFRLQFFIECRAQGVRSTAMMLRILVVATCIRTATVWIQINLTFDVALKELSDFRIRARSCKKYASINSVEIRTITT